MASETFELAVAPIDTDAPGREIHADLERPGRGLLSALTDAPTVSATWLLGTSLLAAGHAALALAAARLGSGLLAPKAAEIAGIPLLTSAFVGLTAALVKTTGAALAAGAEARIVRRAIARVRSDVANRWIDRGARTTSPELRATSAVRLRELETSLRSGWLAAARAALQVVPIGATVIWLSRWWALPALLVMGLASWGLAGVRRRWKRTAEAAQVDAESCAGRVDDLIGALDLWRTFGAGDRAIALLGAEDARLERSEARVEAERAALSGGNEVLVAAGLLVLALWATLSHIDLDGRLVTELAVTTLMAYRPLRDLGDARAAIARGDLAHEGLARTVGRRASGVRSARASNWRPEVLRGSDFGAQERGPAVSFEVAPGDILAVVGATGAGKTTLLRALLGLCPARGALHYGAADLTDAGVGPEHRPCAWVPQEALLVTASIADNVTLGAAQGEDARAALRELGAYALAARVDELVGPGGATLSGGERRLVALARAIATRAPVLLLDEPTEGLDARASAEVMGAIRRAGATRAIVLVTHRSQVAELATRRLRMD